MLPKINKLKKASDFRRIFKKGRLIRGELLDLKFFTNLFAVCRFGFLINLKVSKKATVRNRVKRRLSEIIRSSINQIKPGHDVVIIAKPKIITKNQKEILRDFKNVTKKAQLIA